MANLMEGGSTWAAGTPDNASILTNGEDEKRAEHINGLAAFAVALQGKLGSASSLIGEHATLAERLAVSIKANGSLTSAEVGDFCISARSSKEGWLICDGEAISRSDYADLFAEIGTKYGVGDGSTTFNKPNFCGRGPVGAGTGTGGGQSGLQGTKPTGGAALSARAVGDWFGEETHLLTANESGLPAHAHGVPAFNINGSPGNNIGASSEAAGSKTVSTNSQGPSNASQAHNNLAPSLAVNFFIKY